MNLKMLKEQVLVANLDLPRHELVTFTWGNVSGIDRERNLVVIKPSGVSYERMLLEDMVVLDLAGKQVEGALRPSSDTATHLVLYRAYPELGGVVHTHSTHATAWAQAGAPSPFSAPPRPTTFTARSCSRLLTPGEVEEDYEGLTGHLIVETLKQTPILTMPGVLVANHGPFSWGKSAEDAVHNAVVLEEVARMAWLTGQINPAATPARLPAGEALPAQTWQTRLLRPDKSINRGHQDGIDETAGSVVPGRQPAPVWRRHPEAGGRSRPHHHQPAQRARRPAGQDSAQAHRHHPRRDKRGGPRCQPR